jgi:methanogenic corrinoid protein MtbC1
MTDAGHTISQVANLETPKLLDMAQREASALPRTSNVNAVSAQQPVPTDYYQTCLSAVFNLDPEGLEQTYNQAAVDLTKLALLRDVIVPLFHEIGNLWRSGALKIVNEHMATSVTRTFLLNMLQSNVIDASAPKIFIATTVGQWHDLGALTIALTVAEFGWQPIYFGPNLPAEEIAAGVKHCGARAVAISISHLLDRNSLTEELYKLRKYLGNNMALFVGGSSAADHLPTIEEIEAIYINSSDRLSEELNALLTVNVE